MRSRWVVGFALLAWVVSVMPLAAQAPEILTVYSGRSEDLVSPILEQFTAETGIQLEVRYGNTAEMAAMILEEGDNSPADVYFAQDAGALGALAAAGRLTLLPSDVLERVPAGFRDPNEFWVGITGRARVLVYNTELVTTDSLPTSLLDLTDPAWAGRVGWAPTNGSLQANITAMRVLLGDDVARTWLEGMVSNGTVSFDGNAAIVSAVATGEIEVGLVNHYYIYELADQLGDAPVALHYFPNGDIGSLINVAGAGVVNTSDQPGLAQRLLLYLLGNDAQTYFSQETAEYPLVAGIPTNTAILALDQIAQPEIDLSALNDLQGTLTLMRETGALP
ncbi:MAG: iron ABC transporter substrate-binding protein [Chloroflexota bacterium]|nr:iron ABC transporter substrate-binding protein [Chloroflexota bacterium]